MCVLKLQLFVMETYTYAYSRGFDLQFRVEFHLSLECVSCFTSALCDIERQREGLPCFIIESGAISCFCHIYVLLFTVIESGGHGDQSGGHGDQSAVVMAIRFPLETSLLDVHYRKAAFSSSFLHFHSSLLVLEACRGNNKSSPS